MASFTQRRLLVRAELEAALQLSKQNVQQLIDTHQILPIRITGEERFDSQDVYHLIEGYKATASRRTI
jgi:hypothetical protein